MNARQCFVVGRGNYLDRKVERVAVGVVVGQHLHRALAQQGARCEKQPHAFKMKQLRCSQRIFGLFSQHISGCFAVDRTCSMTKPTQDSTAMKPMAARLQGGSEGGEIPAETR